MQGIWRLPKVEEYTSLSESSIRRRVRRGTFPAPRALGDPSEESMVRAIGWPAEAVKSWVAKLDVVRSKEWQPPSTEK